jgi:hypothetical protein
VEKIKFPIFIIFPLKIWPSLFFFFLKIIFKENFKENILLLLLRLPNAKKLPKAKGKKRKRHTHIRSPKNAISFDKTNSYTK